MLSSSTFFRAFIGKIQSRKLADDFVQFFSQFNPFAFVLAYLPLQMVPLAFFLLKFFFNCFLVPSYALVLFYEPIDRCFELFDIVERHVCVHRKTSCMSLVLT